MSRINPLYITLLLLFLLGILIYQHNSLQKQIAQKEKEVYLIKNIAKEIHTLKTYWGDKRIQKQRVSRLIQTPFIKKFIKSEKQTRDRYKIYLEGIDAINADRIADKIFNSFVKINSFKIVKQDNTKVAMEVEFKF